MHREEHEADRTIGLEGSTCKMTGQRIDFATLNWDGWASEVPARIKVAEGGGQRARLIEMAPGFVEPEWCHKGHVGYVVSGQYITDLEGETLTMRTGNGFILPTGTRHRSRNTSPLPAVVFIVDLDVAPAPPAAPADTASDEEQV
ncbi:MAG TPA: cupin domain-containing protein [Longimicrobiales bacterium]